MPKQEEGVRKRPVEFGRAFIATHAVSSDIEASGASAGESLVMRKLSTRNDRSSLSALGAFGLRSSRGLKSHGHALEDSAVLAHR